MPFVNQSMTGDAEAAKKPLGDRNGYYIYLGQQ